MKLRPIVASFRIGIRVPLRSRLVLALLPLLAAAAVLLPLHLDGDGTLEGALRMAVSWPLGAVFFILSASTLWAGSSALATEIERRNFVSDAVSPAAAFEIWLGRWLGLVALDAVLLALSLAGIYAVARERAPEAAARPVRFLLVRDVSYDEELARRLAAFDSNEAAEALKDLRSGAFLPVAPGEARAWRFILPRRPFGSVALDFSLLSSYGIAQGVDGALAVRPTEPGAPDIARFALSKDSDGTFHAELPEEKFAALEKIDVAFENSEDAENGAGALVSHTGSLRLSHPGCGLALNLALVFAVLLSALSLLAALGLSCGAAFSPPVAAFVSSGIALAVVFSGGDFSGGGDIHEHGERREHSRVEKYMEDVSKGVSRVLRKTAAPVFESDAIGRAGDGTGVSFRTAFEAALQCGLLLPLLFGTVGAAVLKRRELR